LTLQHPASIRAQKAAGAILPPLFFERRRHFSAIGSCHGILEDTSRKPTASIARLKRRLALTEI